MILFYSDPFASHVLSSSQFSHNMFSILNLFSLQMKNKNIFSCSGLMIKFKFSQKLDVVPPSPLYRTGVVVIQEMNAFSCYRSRSYKHVSP